MKDEKGKTLVEVLATLLLLTLVTGVIWTTISVATKFNVGETSTLKLQQEANYIISELQQVHRNCYEYKLTISTNEVKVTECKGDDTKHLPKPQYDGVISNLFNYRYILQDELQTPTTTDLDLTNFAVIDPKNSKRVVQIPTTIARIKTNKPDVGGLRDETTK